MSAIPGRRRVYVDFNEMIEHDLVLLSQTDTRRIHQAPPFTSTMASLFQSISTTLMKTAGQTG